MADEETSRRALYDALGWSDPPARALEALTHRSFANERTGRRAHAGAPTTDNQRLEFLGDAVLGLAVSELLVEAFPDANEGELSRMRSALVKAEALAAFAETLPLGAALRLGRGSDAGGDRRQMNVLADAVESLVAAAYLDGGLERARALVRLVVGDSLTRPEDLGGRDPKSQLQEEVQGAGSAAPVYRVSDIEGPDHDRWFAVEVLVDGAVAGMGRGRSKKLAEQAAARAALRREEDSAPGEPDTDSQDVASARGSTQNGDP